MQQQNKFREQAKTAALDRWYRKRLKAVAKQIAQIALEWEGSDPSQLQLSLFDYSVRLDEWARSVADIMLRRAASADYDTWLRIGQKISRETRRKLKDAAAGPIFNRLREEQVALIRSLPMEAAKKAQEWAVSGLSDGQRYADIAQRIKNELGGVTESRAICIARTETARARSNFTQARAQAVGSTHYVWHTVGDNAVRPRHRELDKTVHAWSDPPLAQAARLFGVTPDASLTAAVGPRHSFLRRTNEKEISRRSLLDHGKNQPSEGKNSGGLFVMSRRSD